MKKCPRCHQAYSPSENFCASDGSNLVSSDGSAYLSSSRRSPFNTPNTTSSNLTRGSIAANGRFDQRFIFLIGAFGICLIGIAMFVFLALNHSANETGGLDIARVSDKTAAIAPKSNFLGEGSNEASRKAIVSNANFDSKELKPSSSESSVTPIGVWRGQWSSPSGALLSQVITLRDDGGGKISGEILWTLLRTSRQEKISKIGLSATEYVTGTYERDTQSLILRGYRKDDPNGVLVMLDSYRLRISDNRLEGTARNGGKWNGLMNLSR